MQALLDHGYWKVSIVSSGSPPSDQVKKLVPGITPHDFYWVTHPEGVTIAFQRLKDAETFVKKGGHMLVAITT